MTNKLKYRQDFEVEFLGQVFELTCYYQSTRTGFRHLCFLTSMCDNDNPNTRDYIGKVCYINRTREEYTYKSVLRQALETIYQGRMLNEANLAMDTVRRVG